MSPYLSVFAFPFTQEEEVDVDGVLLTSWPMKCNHVPKLGSIFPAPVWSEIDIGSMMRWANLPSNQFKSIYLKMVGNPNHGLPVLLGLTLSLRALSFFFF